MDSGLGHGGNSPSWPFVFHGAIWIDRSQPQKIPLPNLLDPAMQPPISFNRLAGIILLSLLPFLPNFVRGDGDKTKALKLGKLPVNRIVVLGNSVTLHPPAPNIGWTGNWGMAASAEDKDFVHLLIADIAKKVNGQPQFLAKNTADFERKQTEFDLKNGLADARAFRPDIVIVAIGANAPNPETPEAKARWKTAFESLLKEVQSWGNPKIFVRSEFWFSPFKEGVMKEACLKAGGVYVDMCRTDLVEEFAARSERKIDHGGVAGHPGDKGMRFIADSLFDAMELAGETRTRETHAQKRKDELPKDLEKLGKTPLSLPKGTILFTRSSSVRLWDLEKAFPDLKTVNHGFGGSITEELFQNARSLVLRHKPEVLVIYEGDNDLTVGFSPKEIATQYQTLFDLLRRELPQTRVVCLAVKPSPSRMILIEKQREWNKVLEALCKKNPNVQFVDMFSPLLDENGKPRLQDYQEDRLHLSPKGYARWNAVLGPILREMPKASFTQP